MIDILEKYAENLKTIFDVEQEMGQYQYLIDLGKNTPDFSNENRSEKNKMYGCMAQVWVMVDEEINKIKHNIVDKLGLGPGLTLRRQVGMMAMIDHIKKISQTV